MIAAQYTQGQGLSFKDVPRPKIQDDELLLRVEAAAICGTDTKIARQGHRKLRAGQSIILGHEFVGTIAEAGERMTNFRPGMRVGLAPNIGCGACECCGRGLMNMCPDYSAFGIDRDGAHTEFVRIPAAAMAQGNVIPLPDGLPAVEAVLAEPLSCAVNGIRAARIQPGDTVLIYGAGPMGLLNQLVAQISGAARVLVIDVNEKRLAKAAALGAAAVFDPGAGSTAEWIAKQTGGRGVDAAVTAVPIRQVQQEALGLLAPFGRLCLFAGLSRGESPVALDTNAIHYKNLIVTGTTGGSPHDYRAALKLIASRRIDVRQVVSHSYPLRDVERAYETALAGAGLKIVLTAEDRQATMGAP
jgi:threonine dehydrogenase-like Zn-dependent dehydrogenase